MKEDQNTPLGVGFGDTNKITAIAICTNCQLEREVVLAKTPKNRKVYGVSQKGELFWQANDLTWICASCADPESIGSDVKIKLKNSNDGTEQ